MKYIPHWVIDALMSKKFKCHHCDEAFTSKNLTALGIRDSYTDSKKDAFYIELICRECKKTTFFEMHEMDIIELSEEVLSEIDADLDAMEDSVQEYKEMDMFEDNEGKIEKKKKKVVRKKDKAAEKTKTSKITLKDIREAAKTLKPEDLKHESFLEMLGMTPEDIIPYKEIE